MHSKIIKKPIVRGFMLPISIAAALALLLSVLVLAFKADASSTFLGITQNGLSYTVSYIPPGGENGNMRISWYPQRLNDRGTVSYVLGAAGVSLVTALGVGLLCLFVHRRSKALLVRGLRRGLQRVRY